MAGECNSKDIDVFKGLLGGAVYTYKVIGPPGEFTASIQFTNANNADGKLIDLPSPKGEKKLPNAPGKKHCVDFAITFVTECEVRVEADCAGDAKDYCWKMKGKPKAKAYLLHVLAMA